MFVDFREGQQLIKTHRCTICQDGRYLTLRWNGKANSHEVRCTKCRGDELERNPRAKDLWLENPEAMPVHTANVLARKYGPELEKYVTGLPEEVANVIREKYGLARRKEGERDGD